MMPATHSDASSTLVPMVKGLLITTAILEAATGVGLLLAPALPVSLLLGATLEGSAASTVARVLGAALVALALACWLGPELRGVALWPAGVAHATLALWCAGCLLGARGE